MGGFVVVLVVLLWVFSDFVDVWVIIFGYLVVLVVDLGNGVL